MILTAKNGEGSLEVSDVLVQATAEFAEHMAELAATALKTLKLSSDNGNSRFPRWFLLELAAVQQIHCWEQSGVTQHLTEPLPSYSAALMEIIGRCENFQCPENNHECVPLTSRVLRAWSEDIAWAAPELLETQMVLHPADEDACVEDWAQFLFDNRHALSASLKITEEGV